jgi:hypothetical protein
MTFYWGHRDTVEALPTRGVGLGDTATVGDTVAAYVATKAPAPVDEAETRRVDAMARLGAPLVEWTRVAAPDSA